MSGFGEDGGCQGLYIVDGERGIDGNGSAVAEGLDGLGGAAREGLFVVCIAGAVEAVGDGEAAADRPDGRVEEVGEGAGALPTARSERVRVRVAVDVDAEGGFAVGGVVGGFLGVSDHEDPSWRGGHGGAPALISVVGHGGSGVVRVGVLGDVGGIAGGGPRGWGKRGRGGG